VDPNAALITLAVGFGGVLLGAVPTRRNDRRSRADELLAEAANDAIRAIAYVAASNSTDAQPQTHYASAVSRVAMQATPSVVPLGAHSKMTPRRRRPRVVLAWWRRSKRHGRNSATALHLTLISTYCCLAQVGHDDERKRRRRPGLARSG
jgi:hypothetical protein